jgi:hypothetical protein
MLALDWLISFQFSNQFGSNLSAVQRLINDSWDWFNLSVQLLLNTEQIQLVFGGQQVDGKAAMTEATRATNTEQRTKKIISSENGHNNQQQNAYLNTTL